MDHAEATKNFVAESYLLGDLSETERDEFESHFFDCPQCAQAVEAGAILAANAKAVFREANVMESRVVPRQIKRFPFAGWSFVRAAPIAACAILALLAGYQNLVQIPVIRASAVSRELVLAPAISVHAGRAQQGLTFSKRNGLMSITIGHEWEEDYPQYEVEIERASDHHVISKAEIAATPSDIMVSAGLQRSEAGSYFLNLYGLRNTAERMTVARIALKVTE